MKLISQSNARSGFETAGAAVSPAVALSLLLTLALSLSTQAQSNQAASAGNSGKVTQMLSKFERLADQPVLKPRVGKFDQAGAFNPTAALLENGDTVLLYRGQDNKGVSRVGLARSKDGIRFIAEDNPVLSPAPGEASKYAEAAEDADGVEDPRLCRDPLDRHNWFLTATAYSKARDAAQLVGYKNKKSPATARSADGIEGLGHWQHSSIIMPANKGNWNVHWTKSGAMVTDDDGRPLKIDGHFWMYYMGDAEGAHDQIGLAKSIDGITWQDATEKPVLAHRSGMFDSRVVEPGPHTLLTKDGILLVYNGADDKLAYRTGWALFDKKDPAKLLARAQEPLFEPETDWEKHNASKDVYQAPNVVFVEGVVKDKQRGGYRFYYGCADSYVGVAHAELRAYGSNQK
ncbi:MAG: glycosidase [Cyanobacteria bacterium REEB67]|nr:glycosidase [Cyanobacteria bacterium REEB67]